MGFFPSAKKMKGISIKKTMAPFNAMAQPMLRSVHWYTSLKKTGTVQISCMNTIAPKKVRRVNAMKGLSRYGELPFSGREWALWVVSAFGTFPGLSNKERARADKRQVMPSAQKSHSQPMVPARIPPKAGAKVNPRLKAIRCKEMALVRVSAVE